MNVLELIEKMQNAPAKQKSNKISCPDCGQDMIRRKSKWGDGYWYGCSGFPDCKKTMKDIY
jgi:ssDNA-binding Zn-finger/Zn-ribbon topoisomerase 1